MPSKSEDNRSITEENHKRACSSGLDYSWIILFASFVLNVIVDGVCFSFGIFYPHFLDYFGESRGKTAWIGSVLNGTYMIMGKCLCSRNVLGFRYFFLG